jgi:DNA-binding transcriptional ArsR family regulator
MSARSRWPLSAHAARAPVFAALGDETRLALIGKLCNGPRRSISQLARGAGVTRQAITKHLGVLQRAGVVRNLRQGRESLFELEPRQIEDLKLYLDHISREWDEALARLKLFVED